MNFINEIKRIYQEYDRGEISDKDALFEITHIIDKNRPHLKEKIGMIYYKYNKGIIDTDTTISKIIKLIPDFETK